MIKKGVAFLVAIGLVASGIVGGVAIATVSNPVDEQIGFTGFEIRKETVTVTNHPVSIAIWEYEAVCPTGYIPISGGGQFTFTSNGNPVFIVASFPRATSNGWVNRVQQNASNIDGTAYAFCAKFN